MTTDKKPPKPPFLHVVGNRDDQPVPGGADPGLAAGGGPGLPKDNVSGPPVDPLALEIRLALVGLAQSRTYTGYHLILHTYNPVTDDETWEAVTQGMTLKDLVFAAANMNARIQDLMASAQESPEDKI